MRPLLRPALLAVAFALVGASFSLAVEHVTLRRDGQEKRLSGELLVKAEDGGLLLLTPDGALWAIQPDELVDHTHDDESFVPLGRDKLTRQLLSELPTGFEVYQTAHYVICYNTSREYASWCGALFERLYWAFTNYWSRKGFKLQEPRFPLVAVVFRDRDSYLQNVREELGEAAPAIIGYYSLRTNRVTMYDLTGGDATHGPAERRGTSNQINDILARPEAESTVATIIHEATHQIAFNDGLQTRFADIPLWVSEGVAVYFETPDLQSAKGWRNIGAVNHTRLDRLREYFERRPVDSLLTLISDDKRIRDPKTALDAYAEAWGLNYYLLRQHPKEYVAYLQRLSTKRQMLWDEPATRLKEFRAAFGGDLTRLDADFARYMQKVH